MKKHYIVVLLLMIVLMLALSATVMAAPYNPFRGPWEATDVDGSHMRLVVGGGKDVFRIRWMDDYWSICDGGPGRGLGTGVIDTANPDLMHTNIDVYCGRTLAGTFIIDFVYDPSTGTMQDLHPASGVTWFRIGGKP